MRHEDQVSAAHRAMKAAFSEMEKVRARIGAVINRLQTAQAEARAALVRTQMALEREWDAAHREYARAQAEYQRLIESACS